MLCPRFIHGFSRDCKGTVSIIFAGVLVVLVSTFALTADYGSWVVKRSELVSAADTASLAGVRELAYALAEEKDTDDAVTRARAAAARYVKANGGEAATEGISVWTTTPLTVVVQLKEVGQQHFSKVMAAGAPTIGARSEAIVVEAAEPCVVALDPDAPVGIEFNLSGEVVANDCSIWSNAKSETSMVGNGSGSVTSATNCAVGTAVKGGGLNVSPRLRSACFPVKDPFADWRPPFHSFTCKANNLVLDKPGTYELEPGTYCGGITIKGKVKVRFKPGLFVIARGQLLVEGGGSITGTNVSFLLKRGATVNLGGASVVDLSAPTSGDNANMLFTATRREPQGTSVFRGATTFRLDGHVYLPTHDVRFSGGPSGGFPAQYGTLVGRTVKFDGASKIEFRKKGGTGYSTRAFSHIRLLR